MDNQNEVSTGRPDATQGFSITEPMLLSLRQTRPWVKLLSIVGFISVGFMVIVGSINIFSIFKSEFGPSLLPMVLLGGLNILIALLYLLPCLYLFKFAVSLGSLLDRGSADELEEALAHQKSFWKFVGILTLVVLSLALLGIAAAIIIPQFLSIAG